MVTAVTPSEVTNPNEVSCAVVVAQAPALETEYEIIATLAFARSDFAAASFAWFCWPKKIGIAIADKIPMMRTTTKSSISENPDWLFGLAPSLASSF